MVGGLENNMMVIARVWGQQGKALLTCAHRHQRQGAENSLSVTRLVFLFFKLVFIEIEARCLFSPRIGVLKSFPKVKGQRKTKLRTIEGIRHHIGSHHRDHQEEKEEKEDERRKRMSTTVGELVES